MRLPSGIVVGASACVDTGDGTPAFKWVKHYRVDGEHSNSSGAWLKMGSPAAPNETQYRELQSASKLTTLGPIETMQARRGQLDISFRLPRQGVSSLVVDRDAG